MYGVDRSRIFVTGLSAGGAMASVMLATYPEIFAGGAIIAGLPYGSASSVQEAFEAMFNERAPSSRALGDHVRDSLEASRSVAKDLSVAWGRADTVVRPTNADHIVRQWLDVHRLPEHATAEEQIGRHTRRIWEDANGETRLELIAWRAWPTACRLPVGADACGITGPSFWKRDIIHGPDLSVLGLDTAAAHKRSAQMQPAMSIAAEPARPPTPALAEPLRAQNDDSAHGGRWAADPGTVIEAAFRAAGLPVPERTDGRMIDPAALISAALKAAGLRRT